MKDQVMQLQQRDVSAQAIFSGMNHKEIDLVLDNCIYGHTKLLYVSPERIQTNIFIERFKRMNVSLIAVDEAHCISQWGYDFRPPYIKIAELRQYQPNVPFIALTASATKRVRKDIVDKLEFLPNQKSFQKSFARPNLSYNIRYEEGKYDRLLKVLESVPGTAIVYARSRKITEDLAGFLILNNISADFYHAGLSTVLRNTKQTNWIEGWCRVMVCTNAFGMGIDKADVRLVVHFDLPDSIEAYYQEAGRAGRDGKQSFAVTLYNNNDISKLKRQLSLSHVTPEIAKQVYASLGNNYELAEGSGKGRTYDFDLFDFCKTFQMNSLQVYNSLKLLSDEAYISTNDAFFMPSRVHIKAKKESLYKYQLANPNSNEFIKYLLRTLEGVFDHYVPVDEVKISSHLKMKEQKVVDELQLLKKHKILDYIPKSDKPRVTFIEERLPIDNLMFNKDKLDFLFKVRSDNVEAIFKFIGEENICRNRLILDYFDEQTTENCNACDICRDRIKNTENSKNFKTIKQQIIGLIDDTSKPLNEILDEVKISKKEEVIDVLEWLQSNKIITRNDALEFTKL